MSSPAERFNALAERYGFSSYLEIGVCRGETFHSVKMGHKTAVDPDFKFDLSAYADKKDQFYFKMTSDAFFANMETIRVSHYGAPVLYDIIYIDGLHVFDQALRDFTNSLSFAHERTIWVFDDTVPSDPWSALPNLEENYTLRRLAGSQSSPWHGDVFKCVFALHDFYPDISYATLYDIGNPQTVCWRTNWPARRKRLFNNLEEIKAASYMDMLRRSTAFNLVKETDLPGLIGRQFETQAQNAHSLWPLIVRKFS